MADGISHSLTLADLAPIRRWVAWRTEPREVGEKPTKIPYASGGFRAGSDRPAEWSARAEAEAAFRKMGATPHGPAGIGIMLGAEAGDGIALGGIDLDSCRDPETGALAPWAEAVRQRFATYAEVSPSGGGAKLFFHYRLAEWPALRHALAPNKGGRKWAWKGEGDHPPGIELYLAGRFFTVTGDRLPDAPEALRLVPAEALFWLIREGGPGFKRMDPAAAAQPDLAHHAAPQHGATTDADPLRRRLHEKAALNPTLLTRWQGDRTGLSDASRSTLAFALGAALRRSGFSFEDMGRLLRQNAHTAPWMAEKGDANGGRELRRIWDRSDDERPAAAEPARPADGWPDPLDFLGDTELTGTPQLRAEHLPDALAPFVFDTAARMGVDPAAVALAAAVACASVASDDWAIQPKVHDDTWTENPRLWGAIVGDPSILKSPVLRATTKAVDALEAEARKRHAEESRKWEGIVAALKADKAPPPYPPAPRCDRYMVEGTTTEALSEVLRDDDKARFRVPAGKVLVRQDELSGWLASMDAYKSGGSGGTDRAAYLTLYNGGRYTYDRVARGSFAIPNWSGCVLGGIQPEPIQKIAKDAADDGLLQRFLYVVPAAQPEGEDRRPDHAALARYEALFPALTMLRPAAPMHGDRPRPVVLHAEAQRHREAIAMLAKARASMPDTSSRLKAALGKWPGTFPRLALTFHLIDMADANARGVEGPIPSVLPPETARRAAGFMRDVLLPHLLRAEGMLFLTRQTGHARWLAGYILASEEARRAGSVTARDLTRAYGALRAPEHRRELEE